MFQPITYLVLQKYILLSFPSSIEDLHNLSHILQEYKKDHAHYIMLLFCSAYIYKQTFAIPGSVFMNILGGSLFGLWVAFPLCCLLTAIGATFCYLLSLSFGRTVIMQYFSDKILAMEKKVQENLQSLFFFLLFLRLFPMSPNWFLNVSSPIVGVPISYFFSSVFIGLMPYNFMCVQTGCIISEIKTISDVFTSSILIKFAAIATVALIPALVSFYMKKNEKKKL
ncbi:transmembrane protein 41A-like [Anneissia japonica]|uniref:transmembrane protein 41A-like n=1 Tax=Anneissia japonica TaxID=1529436 RepID=UPI001425AE29|nr:transmembrane protein 41A-like [Anneissia japonica]